MTDGKSLLYKQENAYELVSDKEKSECGAYCEGYKKFLDESKTERLAVDCSIKLAEAKGFRPFHHDMELTPGDKVYLNNRGKSLLLAVIGKKRLSEGVNISAAHLDSPRIDLKQVPLYEESELAYFNTHYYGGVKKYQWVTIPLELHGVVVRKDGTSVTVAIGNCDTDPQFVITDLLPHLSSEQMKKTLADGITGEGLDILIGSYPCEGEEGTNKVKLNILRILNEKYDITEEDFLSAELMAVPAFNARDIGIDRSLIGGYGQDDRACSYASLLAVMELQVPEKTAVCVLADKEETGSDGVTGMKSHVFEHFMRDLCDIQDVKLNHCFANSFCISADVCNGLDPNYADVSDKRNNARMNYGMAVLKYSGSRGKSGTSDASAEVVGRLRGIFDKEGIIWQMAELGKVDQGGGGTVAMFMAQRNIDTIDAGVPVLSMHAPYEVTAKLDCYMTYRGIKAVFENN